MRGDLRALWVALLVLGAACSPAGKPPVPTPISAANHTFFPIGAGAVHEFGKTGLAADPVSCESCHPPMAASFKDVTCTKCHAHAQDITDRLHSALTEPQPIAYAFEEKACLTCHPMADHKNYDHKGITDSCAMCHDLDAAFAAFPIPPLPHPDRGGADCSSCHRGFVDWKGASGGAVDGSDPVNDLTLQALVPTYSGNAISLLSPLSQTLPMTMVHASPDLSAAAKAACSNCHKFAATGTYFPGTLHSALANLTLAQPTHCGSCHLAAMPVGFVGPNDNRPWRVAPFADGLPAAWPSMKHDAKAWVNGARTDTDLVPKDCGVCHLAPGVQGVDTWGAGLSGTSPALFHAALAAGSQSQPGSCLDCHASTLPTTVLAAPQAALPVGLSFNHLTAEGAQGDCASCHVKSTQSGFANWKQGLFHAAGSTTPSTCVSCHAGERPLSATGWINPDYAKKPFDYGTNAAGNTHGAGQDCVTCHAGPGTGQWGGTQNWASGNYSHTAAGALASTTCISCHTTQRPDLVVGTATANTLLAFDHSQAGKGDCFGCHQATVTGNRFDSYFKANTVNTLPGGDWRDGVPYPGSTFAASLTQSITVNETKLNRSGPNNLVTSTTTLAKTLYNGMLHTSAQLPAPLNAGPTGAPDNSKCWHCHASTGAVVSEGFYHSSLTNFRATMGGPVSALPQPTTGCADCHQPGLPVDIVQKGGAALLSMDHAAQFTQAVMLGGKSVTAVSQADCSVCHSTVGTGTWNDGKFHASIGAAQPKECISCHYPVMADGANADKLSMKHRSGQLTFQSCETCHAGALAKATNTPTAATLWAVGAFHGSLTTQPTACIDCHASAQPLASTQSSVIWPFTLGATATNGAMWMSHAHTSVVGKDCVVCHAADAKKTGSVWSKASPLHAPVAGVTTCAGCHGLTNGGGAVPGTNNNMPNGLTNSATLTSASAATGVAGRPSQITHSDLNVTATGRDCKFCHGTNAAGVADPPSWSAAKFHQNLTAANPLIINGTTARCSNCHLNVKPGPGYTAQDHGTFTNAPNTQDCSSCHSFPGTGSSASPNWLGAAGAPTLIAVGGFSVGSPPAPSGTTQGGIMSLPHPVVGSQACTACHATSGGGKNASGYDHASPLISASCSSCHEAGSNLVATPWNNATTLLTGAGDTRPFSLTSLVASYGNGLTVNFPNHFYPADCSQCHVTPAGNGTTTTGAAYAAAWNFPHNQALMSNPSTCVMCHVNGIPGAPDGGVFDPAQNVALTAKVPRFSATSIASVSDLAQTLNMTMDHASTQYPVAANSACSNCHAGATASVYYPGSFHSALGNLLIAQPTACSSCHANAAPVGFVGPLATNPPRSPATGEMRHDAVAWANRVRGTTALVSTNCAQCHLSPSPALQAHWDTTADGGSVRYHASIATQPGSCLDCHANSRPVALLTGGNSALPAKVEFDHQATVALDDCAGCHAKSAVSPWASWTGGKFHLAGAPSPSTCLPCHTAERPTSTTGWASPTYTQSPFDYGTNAKGITHGNGLDCATCHTGAGTGVWGSTQNWQAGRFVHGPTTASASSCVNCHSTQRPDLVFGAAAVKARLSGFDHAASGTGDCFGCHQATVVAGAYALYPAAVTGLPNGSDWKNGVDYPGSTLFTTTNQTVTVTRITLQRSGNLVTGSTSTPFTLDNAMLHTSAQLPASLNAGPTGAPDNTKCWHCHTTTTPTVSVGQYHASLNTYRATMGGPITPLPQPTTGCRDCHSTMYPPDIVEKAGSNLQPMDHSAQFVSPVTLGGITATAVNQLECSVCHRSVAGSTTWNDGIFHANIGAATPKDCVQCHYPLMADPASDTAVGTSGSVMKHRSGQLTFQACSTCHAAALGNAATATHAATLWKTGALHSAIGPQPTACVDCHAGAEPLPGASTQSTVVYSLPLGGTTTNGAQWLNHGSSYVAGKDCVVCHATDAKPSGSAWSKSDLFHPAAPGATLCAGCHGTTNGKGTVIGTNNNLPLGLTNSRTLSASAGVATTGILPTALAQITHADVNVTAFECATCHTQQGVSGTAGITGKEWAQALFHSHFTGATALVMNGTTGRCSNCHLSEKPGTAYLGQDHSTFTAASGSQDCSSCHSFPGTGTAASPNWLGASGKPTYISVGGFPISQPPATTPTTQTGINNLPHPSGNDCTTCHASAAGGKLAKGYDHASTALITPKCQACHEAGSNLVNPPWNGSATIAAGAGDTRPFTATALTASFKGNTCNFTDPNHFFPINCHECHNTPTGTVTTTTGTTYRNTMWKFQHTEGNMTNPSTCDRCHKNPTPPCPKG